MSDSVESRDEEIIGGNIEDTLRAKDTKKVVQAIDGIIKKDITTTISFASCGHLIHSAHDIGGMCQAGNCGSIICSRCFKTCARCGTGLCNRHVRLRKGENVFCASCSWKVILFGWSGGSSSGSQVSQG